MARRRFALQPLLERRRRIERECLRDWSALERERIACAQSLECARAASRVACGGPATTDWWQTHSARIARGRHEALLAVEAQWRTAKAALQAATLQRRVYEKLEERFASAERQRRERYERHELEEANAGARALLQRVL